MSRATISRPSGPRATRRASRGAAGAVLVAAALGAGCGTVYLDAEDRGPAYSNESLHASGDPVLIVYRRLLERLDSCLRHAPRRVRGIPYAPQGRASIHVDAGIGFDHTLFIGTARYLDIELAPAPGGGSAVRVLERGRGSEGLARAVPHWLAGDTEPCAG